VVSIFEDFGAFRTKFLCISHIIYVGPIVAAWLFHLPKEKTFLVLALSTEFMNRFFLWQATSSSAWLDSPFYFVVRLGLVGYGYVTVFRLTATPSVVVLYSRNLTQTQVIEIANFSRKASGLTKNAVVSSIPL